MADPSYFMYSQNRGSMGMNQGRFGGNPFGVTSSAAYKQFHEMKAEMPMDVIELFKANEVGFLPAPTKPKCRPLDPVSSLGVNLLEMFQIPNLELVEKEKRETLENKKKRIADERKEKNQARIKEEIKYWNPFETSQYHSDPQKTLFVSRLSYETTEKSLKFGFEKYGIINSVHIPKDFDGKSRCYGFVEFDSKQDFVNAYKQAGKMKLDGRRIIVDYQRGRTSLKWRPRRFGEGLGTTRMTKQQLEEYRCQQRQKRALQSQKPRKKEERSRSRAKDRRRDEKDRKRKSSRDRHRHDRSERHDRYR